ncbi:hypothetical protein K0M31_012573 [Melipona bicolor]|uniref:Uncharacterized protein n=1 Tax=Melipona bicolor TaxID=60889 RepID=A0AA40FJU0_9HYME|nr:hypothetical protein K0M31_012573 [Melipona bicolor]
MVKIKKDMAAETEQLKARSLSELSNIKMAKDKTVKAGSSSHMTYDESICEDFI